MPVIRGTWASRPCHNLAHRPIGVRGMGAIDKCALEKERVFVFYVAAFVLVFQAKAQELAPVPTDIRRNAPDFLAVVQSVFGPVKSAAEIPIAVDLLLREKVGAETVLR